MDLIFFENREFETYDENRFGMKSSLFLAIVIGLYLIIVLQIGPRLMKNHQGFKLKKILFVYNIFQVLSCVYIVNETWNITSWDIFNFSYCKSYNDNSAEEKQRFDAVTYFTFWLKIIELLDTVFFVMRKKQNQVTFLHVFHHSSTITLVYLLLKFYRGNAVLYPIFLNSIVHIIMYSYYLLANIYGQDVMKRYIFVKKSITIVQMIQFIMILMQALVLWKKCTVPVILRTYYCLVVGVIFYGFYDFYKKSYSKKQQTNMQASNIQVRIKE